MLIPQGVLRQLVTKFDILPDHDAEIFVDALYHLATIEYYDFICFLCHYSAWSTQETSENFPFNWHCLFQGTSLILNKNPVKKDILSMTSSTSILMRRMTIWKCIFALNSNRQMINKYIAKKSLFQGAKSGFRTTHAIGTTSMSIQMPRTTMRNLFLLQKQQNHHWIHCQKEFISRFIPKSGFRQRTHARRISS